MPTDLLEKRIRAAWRATVEGYFDVGDALLEARKTLGYGHFVKFVNDRLPFGYATARRLCKIASATFLRDVSHAQLLPCDYTTLAELASMTPEDFQHARENNEISADMTRADAVLVTSRRRKRLREPPNVNSMKGRQRSPDIRGPQLDTARSRYLKLCECLGDAELDQELGKCAAIFRSLRDGDDPDDLSDVLEEENAR